MWIGIERSIFLGVPIQIGNVVQHQRFPHVSSTKIRFLEGQPLLPSGKLR